MGQFLFGAFVGWLIARNPGVVQNIVAQGTDPGSVCPPGANCMQAGGGPYFMPTPAGAGGGSLVVGSSGVVVVRGPAVGPADGPISWSGCPDGTSAVYNAALGKWTCV